MTDLRFIELEDLFCRWIALRDDRLVRGDLRPSARESSVFASFTEALEALDDQGRSAWNVRREELECRSRLPRCRCGHPEPLHVEGSCFAIVGCATACDCARDSDRSGIPESLQQERFDLHSAV